MLVGVFDGKVLSVYGFEIRLGRYVWASRRVLSWEVILLNKM